MQSSLRISQTLLLRNFNFIRNKKLFLFLNKRATAIMNMEILENILMARDEIFKTDEKIFIYTVKVQELIHEGNMSLKFNSEFEKSISKEAVV